MASFAAYSSMLLEAEGGYQAHPADSGNYNSLGELVGTNRGISARLYEDIIGRPPSVTDMQAITEQDALEIYESEFWNANGLSAFASQAVANLVMDHAVNAGSGRSGRLLQTVLNLQGKTLIVDGIIGTNTRNAANSANEAQLNDDFKQSRLYYYDYIAAEHSSVPTDWRSLFSSWDVGYSIANNVFLSGWIARVNRFPWLTGSGANTASVLAGVNPVMANVAAKKKSLASGL